MDGKRGNYLILFALLELLVFCVVELKEWNINQTNVLNAHVVNGTGSISGLNGLCGISRSGPGKNSLLHPDIDARNIIVR